MIQAAIFDMDGLLVDSETYWESSRRNYCLELGCDWTPRNELSVKGHNSPEWASKIREVCGMDASTEEIVAGVSHHMREAYADYLPLLPGAVDSVALLANYFPLGLASSSPQSLIEYVLEKANLRNHFSVILSADEAGKGKPNPDVFLIAAERLGQFPSHIVVFEDSSAGILAAKAAGMTVVAVPNEHFPPTQAALSQAHATLTSLRELTLDFLGRLQSQSPPGQS
ncbi:MAG: HAD family phosphatase [Chloroflexota bacterium]